ncbi:hypothetical protein NV379_21580 [Paenibacillus sp. N1-5-1-14]|uniref:hypothetical protein n=1 Tax=Paenibacillus radicibacter TaxID=2972488 RepID=UPI00215933A7|nr:hypothetical protein [Paenibacillus radicibacter]MCR8645251.1 hypothetical protein [Paenibacillus radicibacter]
MLGIARREFLKLFKSFRAIAVIAIMLLVAYNGAKLMSSVILLGELGVGSSSNSLYTGIIYILMLLLGFLFVFSISHDTLNKEMELQTIRYLVTRTSRLSVFLGKCIGIIVFWMCCILLTYGVLSYFAKQILVVDFLVLMSFISYMIGLNMLLSMVIPKSSLSMFIAIVLGIAMPVLGLMALGSDKLWLQVTDYILPYYYLKQDAMWFKSIPFLQGVVFAGVAYMLFRRRDL